MKLKRNQVKSESAESQKPKTVAPKPAYLKSYNPHLYFSNTIRDVLSQNENVIILIPEQDTELFFKRKMMRYVKDHRGAPLDSREYEMVLKKFIEEDGRTEDLPFGKGIKKRYLRLRQAIAPDTTASQASSSQPQPNRRTPRDDNK